MAECFAVLLLDSLVNLDEPKPEYERFLPCVEDVYATNNIHVKQGRHCQRCLIRTPLHIGECGILHRMLQSIQPSDNESSQLSDVQSDVNLLVQSLSAVDWSAKWKRCCESNISTIASDLMRMIQTDSVKIVITDFVFILP